jgi:hypothetical protein
MAVLLTDGENVLFFTSFTTLILAKVVFSHLSFSGLQMALPMGLKTSTLNIILKNHSEIQKAQYGSLPKDRKYLKHHSLVELKTQFLPYCLTRSTCATMK